MSLRGLLVLLKILLGRGGVDREHGLQEPLLEGEQVQAVARTVVKLVPVDHPAKDVLLGTPLGLLDFGRLGDDIGTGQPPVVHGRGPRVALQNWAAAHPLPPVHRRPQTVGLRVNEK